MTVAELIERLKTMRQDVPVSFNDEANGIFHEDIGDVMFSPENPEYGDRACVVLYTE